MTEHSKISREGATKMNGKPSLFERANDTFGLDALTPAKPPVRLPEGEKRVRRPVSSQPTVPSAAAPVAAPVEAAVQTPLPTVPTAEPVKAAPQAVALGKAPQPISRDHLRDAGLIVPEDGVSELLEEFRIVKRELLADARAGGSSKAQQILVSSPHPGEGKTYCAVNLAIALAAERDLEVLLVDADVIKPSVPARLGFEPGKGLMDALADPSLQPETLAVKTDIDNLFVLPAGSRNSNAAEYLASARTGEVLARLTQGAPNRIVIFDTPPALAASAAAELAAHVGQVLLVARADETSRAALEDAQQLLSACVDIKLLLNAAQFSPSGRQFGNYGAQGKDRD